jgi:hypothetical protein
MTEHPHSSAHDPERDPQLAHFLSAEYGMSHFAMTGRARAIAAAVATRAHDSRVWWAVIANWSRALVPISVAVAAAVLVLLRIPAAELSSPGGSDALYARDVSVVDILTTRTTSRELAATLTPPTADDLLQAALRR